jgi:Cu2+-exporting ATPase
MVGIGKGAQQGILIKNAESLERARKVDVIVLDKTGTITEGKPVVTAAEWIDTAEVHRQVVLAMERLSEHPLAEAVVSHLGDLPLQGVTEFQSITGKGAMAKANGETYLVGNARLMQEHGIPLPDALKEKAKAWGDSAQTVIWFARLSGVLATLAIADKVKPTSVEAIRELQALGMEVHMLTGDNAATAKAVAGQTGISHHRAEVMPEQKAAYVKELQAKGQVVAMVGDGINDSTALAQADVSIAMGKGSDIAMDVASMTIISSDLKKIPVAMALSRQTVATIRQNLFWAFLYNLIGIPVAAGILYPFTGFLLSPMIAGAAMALSSVSVVANSLRLKWRRR